MGRRRPARRWAWRSRPSTRRIGRRSAPIPRGRARRCPGPSLPVVIGRAGARRAAGGSSCPGISTSCRRAIPRPGPPTRGAARSATGALYGRGACDMKGGVAAILGAVRALGAAGDLDRLDGELDRRARPVRGGRRPGHARGDPGRRDRRPRDHHRAVQPRRRRRPRRRDHVPAHRSRAAPPTPRSDARACRRSTSCSSSSGRSRPTRRVATRPRRDPLMTALGLPYPTIVGMVAGGEWASTVLDRVDGRRPLRRAPRPDRRPRRRPSSAPASPRPAPRTPSCATIRRRVEITGGRFGSARVPSDHPLPVGLADVAEAVTGRRPALLGEPYGADMQTVRERWRTRRA